MPRRRNTRRRNQSAGGFFDFLFGSSSNTTAGNTEKKNVPENIAEPISMNAPAPNMTVPSYNTSNMVAPASNDSASSNMVPAVGGRRRYKSRRSAKSRKSSRRGTKRYTKRR